MFKKGCHRLALLRRTELDYCSPDELNTKETYQGFFYVDKPR